MAALNQKLLERRALSFLQYHGAQLIQIGNGPDHRIRALLGAKAGRVLEIQTTFGEGLQKFKSFLAVIVAIHLEIKTPGLASAREGITGVQSVFERRTHLGPIASRFNLALLDAPLTRPKLRQQLRFEKAQCSAHHSAQIGELAVIGKDLHQHLKAGNEADRFKATPSIWDLLARIRRAGLLPQPLGLAFFGIDHTGDPLVQLAASAWFNKAQ